jgi:predicted DNA-binding protein YlxM (UPF0122 family)
MSDLPSKYKAFSKVMSVYFKSKEIYGLIVYHDDEYTEVPVYDETVTVPILKIKNPNNIPFSYYALIDLLDEELKTVEHFANISILPYKRISLIIFNNFDKGDFYIPEENEKKLRKCLNTDTVEVKYRDNNSIIYTIYGKYIVDNDFEMYWETDEMFKIKITFEIEKIFVDDLVRKVHHFMENYDDMVHLVYDIRYDNSELFESPVWDCITNNLVQYKTMINSDWQYVDVSIIIA